MYVTPLNVTRLHALRAFALCSLPHLAIKGNLIRTWSAPSARTTLLRDNCNPSNTKMRIAIIGQGLFSVEVYRLLIKRGHQIVGVFTIPDSNGRPDVLAKEAAADKLPVFKYPRWRVKGACLPEVLTEYKACDAELNVLPFCTQFIPSEVIYAPPHKTIIYHPSILPAHRGASAINWTLVSGDREAGLTVFWADDGLDTGPILLQRRCEVEENDTLNSLYRRFLFPEGVNAVAEAVDLVASGNAPRIEQPTEGASYEPIMKKDLARLDISGKTAQQIHNFIRGNDKQPGAWFKSNDRVVSLFGSELWKSAEPRGEQLNIESGGTAIVNSDGLLLRGSDGHYTIVRKCEIDGKLFDAGQLINVLSGRSVEKKDAAPPAATLGVLSEAERDVEKVLQARWSEILGLPTSDVQASTDFFKAGAGSLDASRMIECLRSLGEDLVTVDDVYMHSTLGAFHALIVTRMRHGKQRQTLQYDAVQLEANGMKLSFPRQLFIDGRFLDAASGRTFPTVNPTTEEVICQVALGGREDVDQAVSAAKRAFYEGEWNKMNARDRGKLLYRLADLMDEHREELATLETLDSGAVYTLALKTHVGMSIDTFRYFAGWCDKIEGEVIPINHARPSRDLTFTRKEPIGVCGIVTPWNYPLMMLSWKLAACLAAGNTVVMKPAQVTPLTALKFAELTVQAGFPPGVINILPGSGSVVGQAIADHPDVRKLGFTGSTEIGKVIMGSCAKSNLKKCSLELGGKSPLIIFADCDLPRAVRYGCSSVFFNKGENCIAAGRLFVEQSIHDEFVRLVVEEVKRMKIGDPLDRSTDHGPQNHKAHFEKLIEYCEQGVREGAKLVIGGKRYGERGYFLEPAVFTGVQDHMMIAKEESFGPVMVISAFPDGALDEVLRRANATEYGLASGVFTRDINKALIVSERLEAGTVFVNTYNKTDCAAPFGGFKQSGFGKDLGREALNEYLRTKAVTIEYGV